MNVHFENTKKMFGVKKANFGSEKKIWKSIPNIFFVFLKGIFMQIFREFGQKMKKGFKDSFF